MVWGGVLTSEPPQAGTTSSRGTIGPVIHYTYPYPTDGGVGPASGGLQGARRLAYDPVVLEEQQVRKRVKIIPVSALAGSQGRVNVVAHQEPFAR